MNGGLQGRVSQVAELQDNCRTVCPSRSISGDHALPRLPAFPRRFPRELEILIEIWGIDRNEISWPVWLASASDRPRWRWVYEYDRLLWMMPFDRLLKISWPAWWMREASA
jgi:hypothetical protein